MLSSRAQASHRLHRLALQLFQLGYRYVSHLQEVAVDLSRLAQHITKYDLIYPGAGSVCPFEMHNIWRVEEAERYWELQAYDKPNYEVLSTVCYSSALPMLRSDAISPIPSPSGRCRRSGLLGEDAPEQPQAEPPGNPHEDPDQQSLPPKHHMSRRFR